MGRLVASLILAISFLFVSGCAKSVFVHEMRSQYQLNKQIAGGVQLYLYTYGTKNKCGYSMVEKSICLTGEPRTVAVAGVTDSKSLHSDAEQELDTIVFRFKTMGKITKMGDEWIKVGFDASDQEKTLTFIPYRRPATTKPQGAFAVAKIGMQLKKGETFSLPDKAKASLPNATGNGPADESVKAEGNGEAPTPTEELETNQDEAEAVQPTDLFASCGANFNFRNALESTKETPYVLAVSPRGPVNPQSGYCSVRYGDVDYQVTPCCAWLGVKKSDLLKIKEFRKIVGGMEAD